MLIYKIIIFFDFWLEKDVKKKCFFGKFYLIKTNFKGKLKFLEMLKGFSIFD